MRANALRESFGDWLHVVSPTKRNWVLREVKDRIRPRLTILNESDFMRVSNATIREGESHRVWPPDVLRKFHSADVIRNSGMKHYELRDVSITPVQREK